MYYLPTLAEQLRRVARGRRCALAVPREFVSRQARGGRLTRGRAGFAAGREASPGRVAASDRAMRSIEAVLFLSREPLTSRKLAQAAHLADGTQARTLVRRLNEHYDGCGRALRVAEVAGGYQLLTRPHLADWIRRLDHLQAPRRLSAPAMETLAVIAYRQPVMKAEVDAIRGVDCGEILRQLLERDLVRVSGRSDELGRPYLYATTRRFLQWFGLRSLDDLPRAQLRRGEATATGASPPGQGITAANIVHSQCVRHDDKESPVSVSAPTPPTPRDELELAIHGASVMQSPRANDDDFDDEDEDELEEDLDDEEEEEDEDFEDDDWEEVEDDEEEEDLDEEDEDWDDEDMDDWDDEDEEEEEDEDDEDWE